MLAENHYRLGILFNLLLQFTREEFYYISREYTILYLYETAIFYNWLKFQFQENLKSHLFV